MLHLASLILIFFTLKDNDFSVAQKYFALKETQPKVYVKWKDEETNQWKRPDVLLTSR